MCSHVQLLNLQTPYLLNLFIRKLNVKFVKCGSQCSYAELGINGKVVLGKASLSDLRKSLTKSVEEFQWKITCQISAFPSPYDILISFWLVSDKVKWSKSPTGRKQSKCFWFNDLVSHVQKMFPISLSLKIGNKNKNEQYLFWGSVHIPSLPLIIVNIVIYIAIVNKYLNQSHDAVISPL